MASLLTWSEVQKEHGTVSAISSNENGIRSLLCGGGDYSDIVFEDKIVYKIPNRKYYLKSIRRFEASIQARNKIRVFSKLEQNKWLDNGLFQINNISISGNFWEITLCK